MAKLKYQIFARRWYRDNPKWPNGLEPHPGRKTILDHTNDLAKAQKICEEWNRTNNPGKYSRKAEFTSNY